MNGQTNKWNKKRTEISIWNKKWFLLRWNQSEINECTRLISQLKTKYLLHEWKIDRYFRSSFFAHLCCPLFYRLFDCCWSRRHVSSVDARFELNWNNRCAEAEKSVLCLMRPNEFQWMKKIKIKIKKINAIRVVLFFQVFRIAIFPLCEYFFSPVDSFAILSFRFSVIEFHWIANFNCKRKKKREKKTKKIEQHLNRDVLSFFINIRRFFFEFPWNLWPRVKQKEKTSDLSNLWFTIKKNVNEKEAKNRKAK